ncbi:Aste57867_19012 [Aphanomyces stellatus]|uniref:subtilisin n=1 Tax=Aphanomyces stellatus TaxID=120398 RepID=A0A485LFT6_9STRA|nr:hypothetical protein As57867_018948 [Aphanomyces stellatus]VFT95737.1 Aste57867_19012 [Aphanomyces stellatus]
MHVLKVVCVEGHFRILAFGLTITSMKAAIILALSATVHAKVSVGVLRALETNPTVDVLVNFDSLDLDTVTLPDNPKDVRKVLVEKLKVHTSSAVTKSASVVNLHDCTQHWISSSVYCQGLNADDVDALKALPFVKSIQTNGQIHLVKPIRTDRDLVSKVVPGSGLNQWGVETVGAPQVWPSYTGEGIIVGSIDTGANVNHEAIQDNWRSYKGWFNPYNGTNGSAVPFDSDQHGTHTIGTMVGKYGIGVAPGAQWISCLGLYGEHGTFSALLECAQWMVCPTNLDGTDPECEQGAHVVNNSWGAQGDYADFFEDIITVWRTANITPVFSNGNAGSACATTGQPGGYTRVIGVGAIGDYSNTPTELAYFSSKGPFHGVDPLTNASVTIVKPDVSAPGFFTLSANALNTTGYMEMAGTSMAAPHVSGVVALLKSANPDLTYDDIYAYLTKTADRSSLNTTQRPVYHFSDGTVMDGGVNCGNVSDKAWPNNRFGYGRVNVANMLGSGSIIDVPL